MSAPHSLSVRGSELLAQELQAGVRANHVPARERLRRHHAAFRNGGASSRDCSLADARFVVAREHHHASWSAWMRTLEQINAGPHGLRDVLLRSAASEHLDIARVVLEREPQVGASDICCACAVGDVATLRQILRQDPLAVRRPAGPFNVEPILHAAHSRFLRVDERRARGIVECVRVLLEAGADANAFFMPDPRHSLNPHTALFGAAGIGNSVPITEMLLSAGAIVDQVVLFHCAEFPDPTCLRLVLQACKSRELMDEHLGRAVDCAIAGPIKAYLDCGADPDFAVTTAAGRTHLQRALQLDLPDAVIGMMLDRGASLEKPDQHGLTAYRYATRFAGEGVRNLLRDAGADTRKVDDSDRFIGACMRGDTDAARALISRNPALHSLLDDASHQALPIAAYRGLAPAARALLELGFSVDAPALRGGTALHLSCWRGHFEVTRLLVERGASLTGSDGFYGNALDNAIDGSLHNAGEGGITVRIPEEVPAREYAPIVELLLARGAVMPRELSGSSAVIDVLVRQGLLH